VHMHFSWTEMRDGAGYYRMMADLNPSIENPKDTLAFADALRGATPEHYEKAAKQGDRYFHIPALDRHRGVTHFYLEGFSTGDFARDSKMAETVATTAIDSYLAILKGALDNAAEANEQQKAQQLAYHTAYLFQVLTLDRGTTSGLLVHSQNDQGIMGSLPTYVDRELFASWEDKVDPLQKPLVRGIAAALAEGSPSHVSSEVRLALAQRVRAHYKAHPEALALQASGGIIPPTVSNHS